MNDAAERIIPEYTNVNCVVCGSSMLENVYTRPNYISATFSHFVVFDLSYKLCTECGLLFTTPRLASSCWDRIYRNFSLGSLDRQRPALDSLRRRFNPLELVFFDGHLSEKSHVLEIGCGNGESLYYLAEKYRAQVLGIEPSELQCDYGREVLGVPMCCSMVESFDHDESFDMVRSHHVFEHLADPVGAFAKVHALLADEGHFILEVPSVFSPNFNLRDIYSAHNVLFSPNILGNVLEKTGFDIVAREERINLFYILKKRKDQNVVQSVSDYHRVRSFITEMLEDYKEFHDSIVDRINGYIKGWKSKEVKIAIWGAGEHTLSLLAEFDFNNCNIVSVVDSNPWLWGKKIHGYQIESPSSLANLGVREVLISSFGFEKEIFDQLATIDPRIIARKIYG